MGKQIQAKYAKAASSKTFSNSNFDIERICSWLSQSLATGGTSLMLSKKSRNFSVQKN